MDLECKEITGLVCPIDKQPLCVDDSSLKCDSGHSYDISKSGYINLLAVQFKASKDPGDNKAMVLARSQVHGLGIFEIVALRLNSCINIALAELCSSNSFNTDNADDNNADNNNSNNSANNGANHSNKYIPLIIDAGCGEGYYTRQYIQHNPDSNAHFIGLDISKWAIDDAAKKSKSLVNSANRFWVVGSNNNLPVEKGHASVIVSVFGFEAWKHWSEHQSAHQSVLVVKPAAQHLIELRRLIYQDVTLKDVKHDTEALALGYEVCKEDIVNYVMAINDLAELENLLAMTPHAKKRNIHGAEPLSRHFPFSVTIDVVILHYRKI